MIKLSLIFLFVHAFVLPGTAQEQLNVDSLKKIIQSAKEDTAKAKLLYQLTLYYFSSDLDSSFIYLQQQLLLSEKLSYQRGIGEVYEALSSHYYKQNNLQKGIEYTYKTLRVAEETNDPYILSTAYNSVGNMHAFQGNSKEALAAFKKGYGLTAADNLDDKAIYLANIAGQYNSLNYPDSAIRTLEEARQFASKSNGKRWLAGILGSLSKLHYKQGDNALGDAYLKMAVETAIKTNDQTALAASYTNMTDRFLNDKKYDSALYYAEKVLLLWKHLKVKRGMAKTYSYLAEIYRSLGRYDSAFTYQTKRVDLINDMNSGDNRLAIQTLQFEEGLRQKEAEAKEVERKQEREHNLQYSGLAIGIVSLFICFLVLSHSIVANQKLIRFLGIISLLIVFEFLNLLLHPWLGAITHHSPLLMLLAMVCVAALLIPLHHKLEHWITHQMIEKNNRIRLAAAKRTIQQLEG